MRFAAAAVLLLALASVASARPIGLRSVLSDKEDRYCEVDYAGEDECVTKYGKDLECEKLKKEKCVYEKECKYEDTDKCLEYKEERKCKQGKCTKYDNYGKCTKYAEDCEYVKAGCKEYKQEEVCKDVEVCWTGKCVPKKAYGRRLASAPKEDRYCEVDYAGEDECVTKYGKDLECEKLKKEKCVYEKECKYEDTDKCLKYKEERNCKQGKCTKYDNYGKCTKYAEDCEYVKAGCKEYKQEEVCKDVEVCWTGKCVPKKAYGRRLASAPKEDRYCEVDYAGEDECVTKYGKDLECERLKKEKCVYEKECEYKDTDKCLKYNEEKKCKQGKCTKYDNYGKCTKYAEDCEYVKAGCKEYKQEEVCKDVEVCWSGKCVPKKSYGRK